MSSIFISYKHVSPDEELADFLKLRLAAEGHTVFIDKNIGVGEVWVQAIERALQNADAFVVLISKDSIQSDMVRNEIVLAHQLSRAPGQKLKILPVRVGFEGTLPYDLGAYLDPIQYTLWKPGIPHEDVAAALLGALRRPAPEAKARPEEIDSGADAALLAVTEGIGVPLPAADPRQIAALESGTLTLDSDFYIRRESDHAAEICLQQSTATTIIRAPRQMGKSSLLARMHAKAETMGRTSWYLDFQLVDESDLADLETLFRYLARKMSRAFGAAMKPKEVWDDDEGPKENLTNYLEDAILRHAQAPVQIVFDEVDRIFTHPYRNDFFAALRGWHNLRATNPRFGKLTVVIGHATTPSLWISDMNQSPFNVGHPIRLSGFTEAETAELSRRHGLPLNPVDTRSLVDLLDGHPYLTRVAFHTMATRGWTVANLVAVADHESGPFGDHLRGLLWMLGKAPDLRDCLRSIVNGRGCADEGHFQCLWAAGLVRGETRARVQPRCQLYANYLRHHL